MGKAGEDRNLSEGKEWEAHGPSCTEAVGFPFLPQ